MESNYFGERLSACKITHHLTGYTLQTVVYSILLLVKIYIIKYILFKCLKYMLSLNMILELYI